MHDRHISRAERVRGPFHKTSVWVGGATFFWSCMASTESASAMLWWLIAFDLLCFIAFCCLSKVPAGGLMLIPVMFFGLAIVLAQTSLHDACWSPAAYLFSISGICASIFKEGYAFMLVSLTAAAMLLINRINGVGLYLRGPLYNVQGWWCARHGLTEMTMKTSLVLVTLTGIIPDFAHNCDLSPVACTVQPIFHSVHIAGIGLGMLGCQTSGMVRMVRMLLDEMHHPNRATRGNVPRFVAATCVLVAMFIAWVVFLGMFLLSEGTNTPIVHICSLYRSEAACSGQLLPASWKMALNSTWPCSWRDDAPITAEALCVDHSCKEGDHLYNMQTLLVSEYNALLIWLTSIAGVTMMMEHQAFGTDELTAGARKLQKVSV